MTCLFEKKARAAGPARAIKSDRLHQKYAS